MLQLAQQAVQLASVPKSVDLRQLCPPIRDQGKEESCSGFATAAFRETSYVAKTNVLLPYYLSPAYLYAWTRIDDGVRDRIELAHQVQVAQEQRRLRQD
jgi:hypothetical protein